MLQIGQTFDVFRVDKHNYGEEHLKTGSFKTGKAFLTIGVDVLSDIKYIKTLFCSLDPNSLTNTLCIPIGRLIITKVK